MAYEELFGWVEDNKAVEATLNAPEVKHPVFGVAAAGLEHVKKDTHLWQYLVRAKPAYRRGAQGIGDCFAAGTLVSMADGSEKPIEEVQIGDSVLTSSGRKQLVIDTIKKPYAGTLLNVNVEGETRTLTCTPDHRLRHFAGIGAGRGSSRRDETKEPSWTPAGKLSKGDRLLVPWGTGTEHEDDFERLDALKLAGEPGKNAKHQLPAKITVDEDFGWLVGLYLGDGGCLVASKQNGASVNGIHFSLSVAKKDAGTIERLLRVLAKLGMPASVRQRKGNPKLRMVHVYCSQLGRLFAAIAPGTTYTKRIPSQIFRSPEAVRRACLRGWMEADGHFRIDKCGNGHSASAVGVSVHEGLAADFHRLAKSLKIRATVTKRKPRGQSKEAFALHFYGKQTLEIYPERQDAVAAAVATRGVRTLVRDVVKHGLAKRIKSLEATEVADTHVYCLNVANEHEFIANGICVKNCVSWGAELACTLLEAKRCCKKSQIKKFCEAATESIYGGCRVEITGRKRGGRSDGANGSNAARFVLKYGVAYRDDYSPETKVKEHDLREYSSSKAKSWGDYGCGGSADNGLLDAISKRTPVGTISQCHNFDDVSKGLSSTQCPVTIASMYGCSMKRNQYGECTWSKSWSHQMVLIATRYGKRPGALCAQSWGPNVASGPSGDEYTENLPDGGTPKNILGFTWWVPAEDVDKICRSGDVWVYGDLPDYKVDKYDPLQLFGGFSK